MKNLIISLTIMALSLGCILIADAQTSQLIREWFTSASMFFFVAGIIAILSF